MRKSKIQPILCNLIIVYVLSFISRWDPDRFANGGPHGKRGNEFCPFGVHSRRKCPGYLFSYFEVAVFIAIILQRYVIWISIFELQQ